MHRHSLSHCLRKTQSVPGEFYEPVFCELSLATLYTGLLVCHCSWIENSTRFSFSRCLSLFICWLFVQIFPVWKFLHKLSLLRLSQKILLLCWANICGCFGLPKIILSSTFVKLLHYLLMSRSHMCLPEVMYLLTYCLPEAVAKKMRLLVKDQCTFTAK